MGKTLFFEGAGCVPRGEVANCRIRTAFTNDDGKKIYIEFSSIEKSKKNHFPGFEVGEAVGFCDYCHYITDDPEIDDCNTSRLKCERKEEFHYTYKGILNFVNENCNASFDKIVVLDNLAGYRVFNDNGKNNTPEAYNYGDIFAYNEELTKKRIEKVAEIQEHFKKIFNQRYDNTSYYIENNKLIARINVSDEALKKANWTSSRQFIIEV